MLRDITIGQFYPGKSVIHKLDPRFKLIFTVILIVMLFASKGFTGLFVGIFYCLLAYGLSRIPVKLMTKSLKPILPIIIITAILNLFFIRTGQAVFHWKFILSFISSE